MQWQGLKVPVIILSLLAGLAIIFGSQWLYQKYSFQGPLNAALSGNKAIESYQVSNDNRILRVSMTVNYDADLMETYKGVRQELTSTMGKHPFTLTLKDSRDDVLKQVWYNSQYAIYQAVVQGSYQDMSAVVNREALASGSEARINIDQENIYLRLKHQGHILDEVIPRGAGQINGNIQAPAAGGEVNAQRN